MRDNRDSNMIRGESGGKFIKGATILAVGGMVSKVLGAVFRIPLTNWIGAVGMSYYGMAYSVYSYFLIVATAGLPVAIARMVSERVALGDYTNAHRTYRVSLYLMGSLGIAGFCICFFGAGWMADIMNNPGATDSLKAIAPVLLLAPIVSSFRGYFQGQQNMVPTASSEVTEQMFRVIVGLALSFILVKKSLKLASAGATFGASAGSFAALILLSVIYYKTRKSRKKRLETCSAKPESNKGLLKELLAIAVPITIGSTILPIMMLIDSLLIIRRLEATGWSHHMAKTLYGIISGFCDPLIGFPQVFTIAVAVSLVPAVTEAFTKKNEDNLHKNIQISIKTMMVISFPCMVGLIVLAQPILLLLYPSQRATAILATSTLQVLSIGVVGLSILRTFSSALQGIYKMAIPVINLTIGAVAKIILTYILVGIPFFNVNGAALGNVVAYFIAAVLNYKAVRKYTGTHIDVKDTFVKPFIASLIMGAATFAVYKASMMLIGSNGVSTLLSIVIAIFVYALVAFRMKCIGEEELLTVPKGEKIIKIARRLRLM